MKKIKVYLDLDGTVASLYTEKNWLKRLRDEEEGLFLNLNPMITQEELFEKFPQEKYDIRILSMTPLGASKPFCEKVVEEKNAWLDEHFPALKKRIYKQYGHNKNLKNSANAILIDDNKAIRESWKGIALNPAQLWG